MLRSAFSVASPAGERARLSILIFHRVLAERDQLFPNEPDVARFDEIMRWVKHWFNVLPLEEAGARLKCGNLPARAASITFDDGYADNLINATPVLIEHDLHATFFIATGFLDGGRMWNDSVIESIRCTDQTIIDACFLGLGHLSVGGTNDKQTALARLTTAIKHLPGEQRSIAVTRVAESCQAKLPDDLMLTSNQVKELRNMGMGIGAHTVNHPILAMTENDIARQEIADGRDFLEGLLGERIGLFAYPNGRIANDYTQAHADMVKKLGFDAALTTQWGVSRTNSDFYHLPRFTPWDRTRTRFGLRLLLNTR